MLKFRRVLVCLFLMFTLMYPISGEGHMKSVWITLMLPNSF